MRALLLSLALLVAPGLTPRQARAAEVGDRIDDVELKALDGSRQHILARGAKANVLVFIRPGQEHSTTTLQDVAACEADLAKRGVHWVALVSEDVDAGEARALVAATGIRMPVLVDRGDVVYGRLGVKLHPTIGVVDGLGKLAAREPFRAINYCDRVVARIRFVMGEIDAKALAAAEDPGSNETHSDTGVAHRHANLARRFLEIGQLDQALAEVQKSLGTAPTGEAYALQGLILARQGKCQDAKRAFDVALRLEPGNGEARDGKKGCGP
jgi:tetratricopeptide (TPR) repeat protein